MEANGGDSMRHGEVRLQGHTGSEFVSLCRALAISRGEGQQAKILDAQQYLEHRGRSARTQRALQAVPDFKFHMKAAVDAGQTSGTWGGALADYVEIAADFIASLRQISVFDRLLAGGMRKVPLKTNVRIYTGATAEQADENAALPVTRLTVGLEALEPVKAIALIVLSEELLRADRDGNEAIFGSELRRAIVAATDKTFLEILFADVDGIASTGSTAVQILADLEAMLGAIDLSATSVPYWVGSANLAGKLATKGTTTGAQAFPGMTPMGGELLGLPFLVTDQLEDLTSGEELGLIDASVIGANAETIEVDTSNQATVEIDDDPQGGAGAVQTSLWQCNLASLRAKRYFAATKMRTRGVALLTDVSW
jgi:HK97 family phage major capsid protein